MKLYKIRGWNEVYENSRSRTIRTATWVAIPNKHDGEHFSLIMSHPQGAEIFAAFVLMVQIASKCTPRGTLVRGNGTPHTDTSLSAKCRAPVKWFTTAFQFLTNHTDWLEVEEVAEELEKPYQEPIRQVTASCQGPITEEGKKGREGKGMEGKNSLALFEETTDQTEASRRHHKDSRTVLHLLIEATGTRFRETDPNLRMISARLSEPDVTLAGIRQMIDRQCRRWKGTAQAEYLRPETLFNKTKFDGYYAAREQPIQNGQPNRTPIGGTPKNGF